MIRERRKIRKVEETREEAKVKRRTEKKRKEDS